MRFIRDREVQTRLQGLLVSKLVATVSARMRRPDLRIVCRCTDALLVLALREGDESWAFAPSRRREREAGVSAVNMGGLQARDELERLAGASA